MKARTAVLAALVTVVIVWQVPHTTWFRYALLIALGFLAWPLAFRRLAAPANGPQRDARLPFAVLAVFLLWSVVVALAVSGHSAQSLSDLRAEWAAPALILLLGYGLALRYPEDDIVVRVLFLALVFHAYLQLVTAGLVLLRGGAIDFSNFGGIGNHKANVTYTNTLALAMLIADTAVRARGGRGFLRIDTRWSLLAFGLLLASTILSTTRAGLIVFAFLCAIGLVLVASAMRRRTTRAGWALLATCALVTLAGAFVGLKHDPRWSNFVATAPVAWDTDRNRQWLLGEHNETDLPLTAAGKPVDPSAYYRIAFLKEGLRLLAEHPWGTRVGRDAYRFAVRDKYGRASMSHAHNGFIDLGVSLGFPGLLLWAAFLGSFVLFAARAAPAAGTGLRAALVLAIAGFAARTLLDATVREHILQEFMLAAGVLTGAIAVAEARGRD